MQAVKLEDLRQMSLGDLALLAEEIRQTILSTCLRNGGHLGASLGAVEIAIGLHSVFESPREPILWDVGHQAYAHKLLTGRWSRFSTLRLDGGLSGFLSRDESEHDVFGAGHSSTVLSAALAMAWARRSGEKLASSWTAAVIGDGGLTAGLSFEALNNFRGMETGPLLLVLNDNQMSISENVGAISAIMRDGQVREFFSLFGFDYVGPIDGNDLGTLLGTLKGIRQGYQGRPVVLHTFTQKGRGYVPAEELPAAFHGVSPIAAKTEKKIEGASFSETFGNALCALAERDEKIVAITAAMPEGSGLSEFSRKFPDRFFDVGIAEAHAVTFAAGLATQGFRPVVALYSTFLQRGIDSLIHDVTLQRLGVTLAIDRAGVVGADGPTHHGAFDLAYLGMIPNLTVVAPSCQNDLCELLEIATRSGKPWAIRYPRGSGPVSLDVPTNGGIRVHRGPEKNPKLIAVALGASAQRVEVAAKQVDPESERISVVSTFYAKPISLSLKNLLDANPGAALLVVEDGTRRGGFGEALLADLKPRQALVELVGYGDHFIPHGTPGKLEEREGLSVAGLAEGMRRLLESK